jgi:DNA-directed RNA polymerase subunit F
LNDFVKKSKRGKKRAYVLLLLDQGVKNVVIVKILDINPNTVTNIKK